MKIRLDDVMQSFSFPFDAAYYYYIPLETVLMFADGRIYGKAVNGISSEEDVRDHPDRFIKLPQIGAEGRQKVMKSFLDAMPEGGVREKICEAMQERGQQGFESAIREERLLIAWYNYRDDIYGEFAKRWCEANGLELIR